MHTIHSLEKIARELDPSEEERLSVLQKAISYTNQFLSQLPHYPGYTQGSFEKLSRMKIEENGKSIDEIFIRFKNRGGRSWN